MNVWVGVVITALGVLGIAGAVIFLSKGSSQLDHEIDRVLAGTPCEGPTKSRKWLL